MAEPAAQMRVTVGDVRITYLPDGQSRFIATAMFPKSSPEAWEAHREWLDEESRIVSTIGGFLVETPGNKVVVDTGFGPSQFEFPGFGPIGGGWFLESLANTGVSADDIDTVIYTHLHVDHTGWTSREAAEGRRLTFPNARHVVRGAEWDFWGGKDDPAGPGVEGFQQPLENRLDLADDGDTVVPGITLVATPGHTPGHSCLVISSGNERAIILGDITHCPVQLEESEWACVFDVDQDLGRQSRERMWEELEKGSTTAAASHFANVVFGRLMSAEGRRQWVFDL